MTIAKYWLIAVVTDLKMCQYDTIRIKAFVKYNDVFEKEVSFETLCVITS